MAPARRNTESRMSTVRSDTVMVQVQEVLDRFDLRGLVQPFGRCVRCNALLEAVEKSDVEHELPLMTRLHYQNFDRCSGCGVLYWRGSHSAALEAWLARLSGRPPPLNHADLRQRGSCGSDQLPTTRR
ncbi:MAG: Mut7-C RNAse domain-containing protein [bacterium]